MKNLLIIFLLAFQAAMGQNLFSSVFKECKNMERPRGCTEEKFQDGITSLISKEITADINKNGTVDYFYVSIGFLVDENGKVMPETIEISCENELLKNAIKMYIPTLPDFSPSGSLRSEYRSVNMKAFTFIFDQSKKTFYAASEKDLKSKNIQPDYVLLGTPPIYKGCESDNNKESYDCTYKKISEIVSNGFDVQITNRLTRTVKLLASFVVEKDGSITILKVTCSEENEELKNEYRRVLHTLNDFIPGHFRGVKMRTNYSFPITLKVK